MWDLVVTVIFYFAKLFRITACQAKNYTCASDFPTLPRFFVQTLNMIKHFIVNLKKTIVN